MTDNDGLNRERRYQTIFETTGTAMIVVGEDMKILLANSEFAHIVALPKSEIEGKRKWAEFIDEEHLETMIKYHYARRRGDKKVPHKYESKICDKKGGTYYVFVTVAMIPGTQESVISFINITQEKEAQKALRVAQKLQEEIFKGIPDMAWIKDTEGYYLAVNDAFASFFRKKPEDFLGKKEASLLPNAFVERQKDEEAVVLRKKEQVKRVDSLESLGKKDMWIEKIKTPLFDEDGRVIGIICIARDITEFKKNNEQLELAKDILEEQRKTLEKKNTALQEILSHIEEEKQSIKREVVFNIEQLLLPTVLKMKQSPAYVSKNRLSLLEQNLKDITKAFHFTDKQTVASLTTKETEICNMIKHGLSGKEIAIELKISYDTVETHRRNIRKKLGLSGEKINLSTYLQNQK